MELAVYITGHGYGHLTRTLEVVRRMYALHDSGESGVDSLSVHVRAPYALEDIIDAIGREPDSHEPVRLDIGIVQQDALRIHVPATIAWLEHYFGDRGDRAVEEEADWLARNDIDLALVDIPPRAFDACRLAGVPAVGLANFGWDWIWRELGSQDSRFGKFAAKAARAHASCHLLLETVMSVGLDTFPRRLKIPLVARISGLDRNTVRSRLGLPLDRRVVMMSFGGEGLDRFERPDAGFFERHAVVLSSPMRDMGPPFAHVSAECARKQGVRYCDLVMAMDALITKPGYSTVAECLANRTPLVWTDRGAFPEAEVVAAYIRAHLPNRFLSRDDLLRGRWTRALDALLEQPSEFPVVPIDGADVAARHLFAMGTRNSTQQTDEPGAPGRLAVEIRAGRDFTTPTGS